MLIWGGDSSDTPQKTGQENMFPWILLFWAWFRFLFCYSMRFKTHEFFSFIQKKKTKQKPFFLIEPCIDQFKPL